MRNNKYSYILLVTMLLEILSIVVLITIGKLNNADLLNNFIFFGVLFFVTPSLFRMMFPIILLRERRFEFKYMGFAVSIVLMNVLYPVIYYSIMTGRGFTLFNISALISQIAGVVSIVFAVSISFEVLDLFNKVTLIGTSLFYFLFRTTWVLIIYEVFVGNLLEGEYITLDQTGVFLIYIFAYQIFTLAQINLVRKIDAV